MSKCLPELTESVVLKKVMVYEATLVASIIDAYKKEEARMNKDIEELNDVS